MARSRILLADDHAAMHEEVRALLNRDYDIIGAVQNGKSLVEAAQELKPDVIISDISMPVMTGFEAAAKIRELGLAPRLIFLTVQSAPAYIRKARELGAEGYVLKVYTHEQLAAAVSAVLSGKSYVSPQLKAGRRD